MSRISSLIGAYFDIMCFKKSNICGDLKINNSFWWPINSFIVFLQQFYEIWTIFIRLTPGIRQERPPHLRADGIHPAMRERGRAIHPSLPTIPITGDRPHVPPINAKIIDGRVSQTNKLVLFPVFFCVFIDRAKVFFADAGEKVHLKLKNVLNLLWSELFYNIGIEFSLKRHF